MLTQGRIRKVMPRFLRDLGEIVGEKICHELQHLGQCTYLELLCGSAQHFGEALYGFPVQALPAVFPVQGVRQDLIPLLEKRLECRFECIGTAERFAEYFSAHNAEPDFDEVQPRAVKGGEMDYDSLVLRLEPSGSFLLRVQLLFGRARHSAEFGNHLAERIAAVRCKVVQDIMELFMGMAPGHVASEYRQESDGSVITVAFGENGPVSMAQERENIHGPVTYVLELLQPLAHFGRPQVGAEPFQDLDPGTFVEEEQIGRGSRI